MTPDFLNKNTLRKYPLRASASGVFTDGSTLPNSWITSMQISAPYGLHDLYISRINVSSNFLSVTINNYSDSSFVGTFAGKIPKDYTTLNLVSHRKDVSGTMTTGPMIDFSKVQRGSFYFRNEHTAEGDKEFGRIEASCIFCFKPPTVSKIKIGSKEMLGRLTISSGDNISAYFDTDRFQLDVTNQTAIKAKAEFTGKLNSCDTPIVKKINTVYPDENGNIDIYGIVPIVIDVTSGELTFTSEVALETVCPDLNKISPPADNDSNDYYTNILTTIIPEWKTWPNFL